MTKEFLSTCEISVLN